MERILALCAPMGLPLQPAVGFFIDESGRYRGILSSLIERTKKSVFADRVRTCLALLRREVVVMSEAGCDTTLAIPKIQLRGVARNISARQVGRDHVVRVSGEGT